jgi:hypothetical protein
MLMLESDGACSISNVLLLTYVVATKIGSYPELDPSNVVHILGFVIPYFLPTWRMIMIAVSIFQAWVCVGVSIGKFVNYVCVGNIFNTKLHGLGEGWRLIGCLFRSICTADWVGRVAQLV